jgi:hypothetical protein
MDGELVTAPLTEALKEWREPKGPLRVQSATAEEFLAREYPEKEPLVAGLLHRRDLVAFGARRRNGKTTFLTNLGVALAAPATDFLGYSIPKRRRSLLLILEDDPGEYQNFLKRIVGGRDLAGCVRVLTREDFQQAEVRIDAADETFQNMVIRNASAHEADLVVIDNLAHVVNADFNDAKRIHGAMKFVYQLASEVDCAVIIAAHPRKEGSEEKISLEENKTHFFESIMGSSMFINTTGSLWALERRDEMAVFVGGRQRSEGTDATVYIQRDDEGWFQVLDAAVTNLPNALNTPQRHQAWQLLPKPGMSFGYNEGHAMVKAAMKSTSTYSEWMALCRRLKVIIDTPDGRLVKALGT